jgi:hypothetical protein
MPKRGLFLALLFLVTFVMSAPWATSQEDETPAYNAGPPPADTKLPPILARDQLLGDDAQYPFQTHAYVLASKIPVVLHQQPCYCHCDRSVGHNSLHSCFESVHGAKCSVCLRELYYSYSESRKGKTARQIREGIIRGQWKQVDLQTAASVN